MKTITYIKELKMNFLIDSKKQEKAIIKYWGKSIDDGLAEQDVWEQTRKIIQNHRSKPSKIYS